MPVLVYLVRCRTFHRGKRLGLISWVDAIVSTVPHELHQSGRKAAESFFSKQSVTRLDSRIHHEAKSLDGKLFHLAGTSAIVRLDHVFSFFSEDIVDHFACGENPGLLEGPDFNPEWSAAFVVALINGLTV